MAPHPQARKLTTHQKAVLIQVLRTFPNEQVEIRYESDAPDAFAYAEDFLSIFKAIGWDVAGPDAKPAASSQGSCGLVLSVPDGTLPACAEALRDALRICEISLITRCQAPEAPRAGTFILWIGPC